MHFWLGTANLTLKQPGVTVRQSIPVCALKGKLWRIRRMHERTLPFTLGSNPFTPPDWATIHAAHQLIRPWIHRTPVLTSASIDQLVGAHVFFKCENLQKTGSFKIRGATNGVFSLSTQETASGVVTHSSGNHGAAIARAATWRGIPAWIVMPRNAPKVKIAAVESYGGRITFCGPTVSSRSEVLAQVQHQTGAALIHPYDDDRVIAGQATAAKELLEDVPDLNAVLAPVSGGGLLSATCLSSRHLNSQVQVFGCEPERANDAYQSLQTGSLQKLESSDTIADGLRASLAPRTFAILRRGLAGVLLVSEDEIISAMRLIWERMKILVEPSAAVAFAPLLKLDSLAALGAAKGIDQASRKEVPQKIGVILTGGNVDLSALPF
jgi:threonine dehydratase